MDNPSATLTPTDNAVSVPILYLPDNYPTITQKYTSCRWRLSYMLTMAITLVMILRNCMSFALVCMTGEVTQTTSDKSSTSLNVSWTNNSNLDTMYTGEFDYSSETQGLLISSPYYAAVIGPLVGSFCSYKFGAKRVIVLSLTISGIITILTPLAARTHLYLILASRIITGFAVSAVMTVSFDLWLYWAPLQEKEQLISYTFAGYSIGQVLLYLLSGFICLIPVDNGWTFIFYIFGCCTLVWCGIWYLTVFEAPETHPGISEFEKVYIIKNRTLMAQKSRKIPWKSMATSRPLWAYLIVFFCYDWNSSVLYGYLPLYMATVLNFDVTQNGLLSSLPYITRGLATFFWGYISVKLTRLLSVTNTRKLMQIGGFLIAAAMQIGLCYVGRGQEYIAVVIFIICTPFQVITINSAILTPVDMAPQYSSVIISLGSVFSMLATMVSPLMVSYIITDRSRQQWTVVFYSNAAIYIFASLIFLLFGSGELQSWAKENPELNINNPVNNGGNENMAYVSDMDEITYM